ncbi:hypothetical protein FRC10_000329 [Ceratobasidium sp. 414]|nr:hypothetical protein FRC10_000329 [Ceratobasidium sp. 414]
MTSPDFSTVTVPVTSSIHPGIKFEPSVSVHEDGRARVRMDEVGGLRQRYDEKVEEKTEEKVEGAETEQVVIKEPEVKPNAWFEGETEDAYWEETFGSWTDTKLKGPESFSLDINFPGHAQVYGIPQHAAPLDLPTTTGESSFFGDPYRLYNLDVFEYEASSTMPLYGSIPLLHAHNGQSTLGVFVAVRSETWIDIARTPTLLKMFGEADMPVDVFWLDIEYAKDYEYFIWDEKTFPDPVEMTKDVMAVGRKVSTQSLVSFSLNTDGLKDGGNHRPRTSEYPVYKAAQELNVLVKRPGGNEEFEGWCWSGSSAWVDFFDPASWEWWVEGFV